MTDHADLIAEANQALAKNQWTSGWGVESLAERLVDALEAAVQERDTLAAVVERATKALAFDEDRDYLERIYTTQNTLATAPAVSLAEHDAQVLEAFAAELRERYPEDVFIKPTAEDYAKLHAALVETGLVIDRFSADLMRRAAAQMDAEAARIREEGNRG